MMITRTKTNRSMRTPTKILISQVQCAIKILNIWKAWHDMNVYTMVLETLEIESSTSSKLDSIGSELTYDCFQSIFVPVPSNQNFTLSFDRFHESHIDFFLINTPTGIPKLRKVEEEQVSFRMVFENCVSLFGIITKIQRIIMVGSSMLFGLLKKSLVDWNIGNWKGYLDFMKYIFWQQTTSVVLYSK